MNYPPSATPLRFSWRAVIVSLVALALLSVFPASATCTAIVTVVPNGRDGGLDISYYGAGASGSIVLYGRLPNGEWYPNVTCNSATCQSPIYHTVQYCLYGTHYEELLVSCYKTDGTRDDNGYASTPYQLDHTPSIESVDAVINNYGAVMPSVRYRAPAALGGTAVMTEWLGGSSAPLRMHDSDANDGEYTAGSSVSEDPTYSKMLLITVLACADKKTSTVINSSDNSCPSGDGPSCPDCAGKPIRLASGNMRMTDRDPLPGNESLSLVRTYDSRSKSGGVFGNGWISVFDAHLLTYQSKILGTQFLEFRTASNSDYLFQNVDGQWQQMWPKNTAAAILIQGSGTYTLREPHTSTETVYNAATGQPLRVHSRASGGRDTIISYTNGFPTHVSDSWGNWSWTITKDAGNRISSIAVDGTSLLWTYSYDGSGNLVTVLGPSNATWRTYGYVSSRLTEARDGRGGLIESHAYTSDYPGTQQATSSISDQDDITAIAYELPGRDAYEKVTRTTSATGAITQYYTRVVGGRPRTVQVVGHCATCGTNDAVYGYDSVTGHLIRDQDARGYINVRQFDATDRITSLGGPYRPANCDPATDAGHCRQTPTSLLTVNLLPTNTTLTTTYVYGDSNWPDIATLTSSASVLSPAQGRTTAVALDPSTGTVTQQVTTGMTGIPAQSAQYTTTTALYNGTEGAAFNPGGAFEAAWASMPQPAGLRKSTDGPRSDVNDSTTWIYYPINAAVPGPWRGRLAAVQNAAGHVTRFENYDVFGNAARIVDANGVATEYTFDSAGRVLTTTLKGVAGCDTAADPLCATDLVSSRTYQPALGPLASTTMPGGGTTTYEYDSRGRTNATTRQVSASAYERIEYDFDPATGRKSAERYLAGHPGAWTVTRSDAFQYTSFARLSEIDHPDGTKVVYHYDGANNLSSVQDERHTAANTSYAYDPSNRLSSVAQTLTSAPSGQIVTAYAYDIHGNLNSVTDPNGNVTSYVYDDFGRMISQTSPVTGLTTYDYDPAGDLASTTDANSATTTRTYDVLGRVTAATAITSQLPTSRTDSVTEAITWSYDDIDPAHFGRGRLASTTEPSGTTAYRYDRRGLLVSDAKTISGQTFTSAFQYDADGSRSLTRYPSGRNATFTFDYADRPTSAAAATTTLVSSATYLPFGPAKDVVFGNGTARHMTFDNRYRLSTNQLAGPSNLLVSNQYHYDDAGNITAIDDLIDPAFSRTFGYDDLNRLTTANSGEALWGAGSYDYDAMGNMRSLVIGGRNAAFIYDGTTPKLLSVAENNQLHDVDYDAAGNELHAGGAGMAYTPSNHLQRWNNTTYTYDARGVRTSTVRPVSIVSVIVTPSSVTGGSSTLGTVALSSPAPAGGALVMLTSDRAEASAPASVTVLPGQTAATFPVMTTPVSMETGVILTAAFNGLSARGSLTVNPSRTDQLLTPKSSALGKRAGGSMIFAMPKLGIKPLAGRDGEPPPPSGETLFERQCTFYTPELNLMSETTSASMTTTPVIGFDYIWFGGQPLAQIENGTGNIAWYVADHLGTPIRQTDNTGHIIWHGEYEPYGTIYAMRRGEGRHQPLRLPGQTAEEGSDLYQNVFRFYRAGWGRYTQADPLGLGPDIHVYRYGTSNPISIDDPLGLDTAGCDEIGKYLINETPCRLECCAQHDRCYDLNHCSAGSWPGSKPKTGCDTTPGCRNCNDAVKDCFRNCLRKEFPFTKDDPKKPNYYCGAQHRFIRIPGDFANIGDARRACECDYSKSCGLPSKPPTPTVPKSKP